MAVDAPQLISRSCTSGWLDWVCGDLWLTQDELFRISRGKAATRAAARERRHRRGRSTVPEFAALEARTPAGLAAEVAADDRNRQIARSRIREACLHRGRLNGRLAVVLDDATRIKLLWLKDDPAHDVLAAWLGDRLVSTSASR